MKRIAWAVALSFVVTTFLWSVTGSQSTFLLGTTPGNPASSRIRLWSNSATGNFECLTSSGGVCGFGNGLPPISYSAAHTTTFSECNAGLLHPTADNNARTITIDSNANVACPVGSLMSFHNQVNTLTIAITTDTLQLAGGVTTGSRTLAAGGVATAWKITSTLWVMSGSGLT